MADSTSPVPIASLNRASPDDLRAWLRACCASRRWLDELTRTRPYADLAALRARSDAVLDALPWPDLLEAVEAHPRIGQRADGAGTEAAWSRAEQSAAATEDDKIKADLLAGNRAYEDRFGHVFLICAPGLSAAEILAALRLRLDNSADAERLVVRTELTRIVRLRLEKLVQA